MPRPTFATDIVEYADDLFGDFEFLRDRAKKRFRGGERYREVDRARPVPGGKGPVIRDWEEDWDSSLYRAGKFPKYGERHADETNMPNWGLNSWRGKFGPGPEPEYTMESFPPLHDTLDKMPMIEHTDDWVYPLRPKVKM
jgi:hypothetical protein